MIVLGERIKELRQRDGRTQEALAVELGVTAQAVSRWEKGICYPDMELIPSIANFSASRSTSCSAMITKGQGRSIPSFQG